MGSRSRKLHLDTDPLRFVGQHVNEAGVGDLDKALIGPASQVDLLLPAIVLADDQRTNPLLNQGLKDATAGEMQIGLDAAIALVGQTLNPPRGLALIGQQALQACSFLVVELVDGLQRSAVNQKRRQVRLVEGDSRQVIHPQVKAGNAVGVSIGGLNRYAVYDFDHIMGLARDDAHLVKGLLLGFNTDFQLRGLEDSFLLEKAPADGLVSIDQ